MTENNPNAVSVENGDLVITRIFDAPREAVWKAWTEPERAMQWWGPAEYTSPACRIDLQVGGKYHFCMRGPDGKDIWSTGTYHEIVPMERLVCTDSFADTEGNIVPSTHYGMEGIPLEMIVTVTFEDTGEGKTKMTLVHSGFSPEMGKMAGEGWSTSFDKLAASLK